MPSNGSYIRFAKLYFKAISENSWSNPLQKVSINAYEMLNFKKD